MKRSSRIVPALLLVSGLAALPLATACAGPSPLAAPSVSASTGSLSVSGGTQAGEMGEIRGFDGAATRHEGEYYGSGASVRIDSEGSGWWVMSRLDFSGDLAGPSFAPGTHRTYASGVSSDPGDASSVSVTGCSGPSYSNYTFDTQASTVEITVGAAGSAARRIDYVTSYGGQVTRGSFVYVIPRSGTPRLVDPGI